MSIESFNQGDMDHNYREVLRIASNALTLRYAIKFSALYWLNENSGFDKKATVFQDHLDKSNDVESYILSDSMIGAVRKPLIIHNTGDNSFFKSLGQKQKAYLLIVIPLYDNKQIKGILAFWGNPEESDVAEGDRRLLDVIGKMVLDTISGLLSGRFKQASDTESVSEANARTTNEIAKDEPIDSDPAIDSPIFADPEEFEAPDSDQEMDILDTPLEKPAEFRADLSLEDEVFMDMIQEESNSQMISVVTDDDTVSESPSTPDDIEKEPIEAVKEEQNIELLYENLDSQDGVIEELIELPFESQKEDEAEVDEGEPGTDNESELIKELLASEALANSQTESLNALVQHSNLGLMLFDNNCEILTDHALTTTGFFKVPIDDKTSLDILFNWGTPLHPMSASFEASPDFNEIQSLFSSVFSRTTDLDVFKELLPIEIIHHEKIYSIEYFYLKSSVAIEDDRIFVVFEDVSREKKLASQYSTEIERNNMIIKVALDVDGYYQFKSSSEQIFSDIREECSKAIEDVQFDKILHSVQSIQGGAEIFEINEITLLSDKVVIKLENSLNDDTQVSSKDFETLVQCLSELEETFQHLQTQYLNNLVSDEQILDKTIYRVTKSKISSIEQEIIENVIQKKMKTLENVFERNYLPFTRLKTLKEITGKRLNRIKAHIHENVVNSSSKEIVDLMASLRKQPVGLILKRYAIIAVNLGERQKKRVEVEIKGAEIEIPLHSLENLFNSLTYVIRNAVEHGLEPLNERMNSDKSLEGKISIEVSLEEGELKIIIADDGKGIDIDKLKQSALKNSVISEEEAEAADDNEILLLLFKKGFSTKKDVGGTFGRGVGLSTVGSVVEDLNGTIFVQTEPGKGSAFEISLPLPA